MSRLPHIFVIVEPNYLASPTVKMEIHILLSLISICNDTLDKIYDKFFEQNPIQTD